MSQAPASRKIAVVPGDGIGPEVIAQATRLLEELNRRKAIVYVHPNTATCCTRLIPEVADTAIEFGTDTTRAIASYIYRGAAKRYPNVRMIWSHSGGTMPFLIERLMGKE